MPDFERGDVVRAPFPYTDRDTVQHRPAVVVATGLGPTGKLCWVVMVTSAENRSWPGDVSLEANYEDCGLPAPSLVRSAKIATTDRNRLGLLGRLPAPAFESVLNAIHARLSR
ncbi:MAG: growth inhibitor PemK [Brevundimonas sp. 12-68-7]|nr:MAG: growth inhibitor PemK [Brevundimonas sp. 12-68-7]OYX32918.1 MAG: growth inhibitor PemK [Brevundimonas subvibrioides]